MNDAELTELAALIEAKPERGWVARARAQIKRVRDWLARLLATALATVGAALAGGLALNWLGVNGHLVIRGLVLASPVMAAALLVFLRHAWAQNFIAQPLTVDRVDAAEPASQDHLASAPVANPARDRASQSTAPVTVLPLASAQPTIPIPGVAVAKAGEPVYIPWEDPDGDD